MSRWMDVLSSLQLKGIGVYQPLVRTVPGRVHVTQLVHDGHNGVGYLESTDITSVHLGQLSWISWMDTLQSLALTLMCNVPSSIPSTLVTLHLEQPQVSGIRTLYTICKPKLATTSQICAQCCTLSHKSCQVMQNRSMAGGHGVGAGVGEC